MCQFPGASAARVLPTGAPAFAPIRLLLVVATLLVPALLQGCDCGGGQGSPCELSDDCRPGLFCDPASFTCEPVGVGTDGGTDAIVPDSAIVEYDAETSDGGLFDAGHSDALTFDGGISDAFTGDAMVDTGTSDGGCTDLQDDDGDGFTLCDRDCDDMNPLVFPGAPEICGDLITNDCDSMAGPDVGCGGIGTYVAPPPVGSAAGTGTQADPLDTISAAITNSVTIEGTGGPPNLPVFVARGLTGPGIFEESITLLEGVSLLGGFEPVGWTRDTAANLTIINPQVSGLFAGPTISRATVVEGFVINSMRTVVPLAGPTTAVSIDGGEPVLRGNVINAIATPGIDVAISISSTGAGNIPAPLIVRNVIHAAGGGSFSAGITAVQSAPEIINNAVVMANGSTSVGIHCGLCAPGGTLISLNLVDGSGATSTNAAAIELEGGGAVVDSNVVHPGTCNGLLGGIDACAGIRILTTGITSGIYNNLTFGGTGYTTVGIEVIFSANAVGPALVPVEIINNDVYGGDPLVGVIASSSSGIVLRLDFGGVLLTPVQIAHIHNNMVHAGSGDDHWAIREDAMTIDPVDVLNNALFVLPAPTFSNIAAFYRDEGFTDLSTVAGVNALMDVPASSNIESDCMLVNPVWGGDFHLSGGSACIDAGTTMLAPATDFEGDGRGVSPDIGADEL